MGYKLKRILIYPDGVTEKQVRPGEIIETYQLPSSTGNVTIAKNGYKITQIVIELYVTSTYSGSWAVPIKIGGNINGTLYDYGIFCAYNYTYHNELKYGGIWSDAPSTTFYHSFPSTLWNQSSRAYKYTITENGGNLKAGTSDGNWTYNQDITYTTAEKSKVSTILGASDIYGRINYYSEPFTAIKKQITVTYKPA